MGNRVEEILSYYTSDNPGSKTNIARLLRSGKLAGTFLQTIMGIYAGEVQ